MQAMPSVGEQFDTFHAFASADLFDIYGDFLDSAVELKLNEVRNGVFVNDGSGRFEFRPLPHLAQIAPVMGIAVTHLTDDLIPDLVLAQNNFSPQRESGRLDGGLSTVLIGTGTGEFRVLPPLESGIHHTGDARSLTVVDFDNDNRPDFGFARNSGSVLLYRNQTELEYLKIMLSQDETGNPDAVGARVWLHYQDGTICTDEITAGEGYLSQNPNELFAPWTPNNPIVSVKVRWPNGKATDHPLQDQSLQNGQLIIRTP